MSMSLIAIKNHMSQVKIATLGSLCNLFNTDPETLRCMLKHWMCKGKIRKCTKKPACGSQCFKCETLTTEIYEWVNT
jgi:hypothetical protein